MRIPALVPVAASAMALALSAPAALAQSNGASAPRREPPAAARADAGAGRGAAGANTAGRRASAGRMAIVRAQAAFAAHDLDAAMAAYREAASEQAERAEGTFGTGVVLAARNDTNGALAAYREAVQQASGNGDDLTRVRALQAIANTLEATRQWDEAIAAWNAFIAFAQSHPTMASAANGRARVQAIQARAELGQRYAPVRQRIEERRRQNARGPQPQSGT